MTDPRTEPAAISYATPDVPPARSSAYGVAAVVVGIAGILWFCSYEPMFTPAQRDRIGWTAGALAVVLAVAGYYRPHCKRTLARVGFWLGVVDCFVNFAFPTL